jgi:hypothetical protein
MAQILVYGRHRSGGRDNGRLKGFSIRELRIAIRTIGPDRNFLYEEMMRYKDEKEIDEVVRGFETATISRDAWKHAEHLTVALHYLTLHDIETATAKMREGIFKLLGAFGVDLTNAVSRDTDRLLDAHRGRFQCIEERCVALREDQRAGCEI